MKEVLSPTSAKESEVDYLAVGQFMEKAYERRLSFCNSSFFPTPEKTTLPLGKYTSINITSFWKSSTSSSSMGK